MSFINPAEIVPNNLMMYLNQWVKVASNGRIRVTYGIKHSSWSYTGNSGYIVFKCAGCGDNWHVGLENFIGTGSVTPSEVIPAVLSDWVKKHRHVCGKFKSDGLADPLSRVCMKCQWPFGAHEESWMDVKAEAEKEKEVKYSAYGKTFHGLPMKSGKAIQMYKYGNGAVSGTEPQPPKVEVLPQFTGRKFRDVEG